MKRLSTLTSPFTPFVSLVSLIALSGCAAVGSSNQATVLAELNDAVTGSQSSRVAVAEVNGTPAMLYSTKEDRVGFALGDKRQLVDETARVRNGGGYFQLKPLNGKLHAIWWSHQDGKNIYLTSSADDGKQFAPVSMVNSDNGVLPPFSMAANTDGVVGMTYQDERLGGYQAYANRSADGGRNWANPDTRLDEPQGKQTTEVHESQMVQVGNNWVSTWTDILRGSGQATYRIMTRRSEDGGLSWSAPVVIGTATSQFSSLILRVQGGNIVAAADELNQGIVAYTSADAGRTWRTTGVLPGTEKLSNSGVDLAVYGSRAHVVWMQERQGEKVRVMRASFDVPQAKWLVDAPQRLDVKQYNNTKSLSPSIVATTQGALVASWVDYRDIRPNIYLAASYDQGQNWSLPQALLTPGETSAGWPQMLPWGNQAAIGYEVYAGDRTATGKYVLRLLPAGESARGLPGLPTVQPLTEADRKAKLEQRIKALWDYRIAGNYEAAYDIFDFAYKSGTPKKAYSSTVGVITYLAATVKDLAVNGNEADVNMKLRYEVQPTIVPSTGKSITLPAMDVDAPNKWVWVGNDWFLVYTPSFEPAQLKY